MRCANRDAESRTCGNQQRSPRALCGTGRQGATVTRSLRTEESLPFLHEPRVPYSPGLDPQLDPNPARSTRWTADLRAGETDRFHPEFGPGTERDGQRFARPGQDRGGTDFDFAGLV